MESTDKMIAIITVAAFAFLGTLTIVEVVTKHTETMATIKYQASTMPASRTVSPE